MGLEDKVAQLQQLLDYKNFEIEQMKKVIEQLRYINETNQLIIDSLKSSLKEDK